MPLIEGPLRGVLLPAEPTTPISEVSIATPSNGDFGAFMRIVKSHIGADFFEVVRTTTLDALRIGDYDPHVHVVMLVDEDGVSNRRPINFRAWMFYPDPVNPIYGDALMIAEDHSDPLEGWELASLHDYITPQVVQAHTGPTKITHLR